LEKIDFAAVFKDSTFNLEKGYTLHPSRLPIAYRIGDKLPNELKEYWRKIYVDVTQAGNFNNSDFIEKLSTWLNTYQPISLAVNGDTYEESYALTKQLFERTAMVVYTVGSGDNPALTAQARPQDGEVFGEFPPRNQLNSITKYPVIVPSSTPSYNSSYNKSYLIRTSKVPLPVSVEYCRTLIKQTEKEEVRGYLMLLINYLLEACSPREGHGTRTSLWGLQRPPKGQISEIRCEATTSYDAVAMHLLPFYITSAKEMVSVSCDPENTTLLKKLEDIKDITLHKETPKEFKSRTDKKLPWNIIAIPNVSEYPLVGQFVSLLFPLGHLKCTKPKDKKFLETFLRSEKWLHIKKKV